MPHKLFLGHLSHNIFEKEMKSRDTIIFMGATGYKEASSGAALNIGSQKSEHIVLWYVPENTISVREIIRYR